MARDKHPNGRQGPTEARPGAPKGAAARQGSSPTTASTSQHNEALEPPARAAAYIPPTVAPKETRYHTIDMKAVRLSPDIDPQRMKTQLSLRAVRAATAEPRPSHLSTWLVLLLVGGALGTCAWWFARWQRVQATQFADAAGTLGGQPLGVGVSPAPAGDSLPLANVASAAPVGPTPSPAQTSEPTAASISTVPMTGASTPSSNSLPFGVASDGASAAASLAPVSPSGGTPRSVAKPLVKPRAASRKSAESPAPAPGGAQDDTTSRQPKLWLE